MSEKNQDKIITAFLQLAKDKAVHHLTVSELHEEKQAPAGLNTIFDVVDRAAIGLGSVFMRTKAEVNWHQLFHELIDDFDADTLTQNQKHLLDKVGLTLTS